MKILIIGGGNMGMTYGQAFLRSRIVPAENLVILERTSERVQYLRDHYEGRFITKPEDGAAHTDLMILAVKPQDAHEMFAQLRPYIQPDQLFVSIMAGITIQTISEALGVSKVIRAMPNLPAQMGAGMTVFTSSDAVSRIELLTVQNLLNTTGKTLYVGKEVMIDAATAISGSGPAYVFFFMNAMMEAAQQMGFSPSEAELLVAQTFTGAVDLYNKSDNTCNEWIGKVASKGGTTEAALRVYTTTTLHDDIIAGAQAAFERAKELGR